MKANYKKTRSLGNLNQVVVFIICTVVFSAKILSGNLYKTKPHLQSIGSKFCPISCQNTNSKRKVLNNDIIDQYYCIGLPMLCDIKRNYVY